ncbi:M48 family metalloprotease [Candidatus Woesearchaeota archaeon]|nr:M48 family metalloprotease [Candidatus Woesearchaeota archaeon]
MKIKLWAASLFTLGILFSFVFSIILAVAFFLNLISIWLMIFLTIFIHFILWLVSPYISDWIYKWFYQTRFYTYEEISNHAYAKFLKKVCNEHNIRFPKIGIIQDQNPTAFTYGSASFNARIILTEGLFKFLDEKELEAVIAHETGHIVNKDFILMTIASTLLSLLYQFYTIFAKNRTHRDSNSKEDKLAAIGLISFAFYFIGTYLLMFLSRTREYYADEFAVRQVKDPNLLSSALMKIAYGIAAVPDDEKTARILNSTRAIGIFDFKAANEVSLIRENSKKQKGMLERALAFDFISPWAMLLQLKSTHPLVGRRIKRLSSMTDKPMFDFSGILSMGIDKRRIWLNFLKDAFIKYIYIVIILFYLAYTLIFSSLLEEGESVEVFSILSAPMLLLATVFYLLLVIAFYTAPIIRTWYMYPKKNFEKASVLDCMADIYASPVRGRPIEMSGSAIGRGHAGFIFGEDMMFRDKSGIIYLNYESPIPILGNLYFGWKKVEKLLNEPASIKGWFVRGVSHHVELYRFNTSKATIKSYVRMWSIIGQYLLIVFVAFMLYLAF